MRLLRGLIGVAIAGLVTVGVGAAAAGVAQASTKPAVSLTLVNDKVSANQAFTAKYSSSHLPKGTTLYLQWQVGSEHVWRRYAKLEGTSGRSSQHGQRLGAYNFRIYASTKTKAVASSATRTLYSYGNVPLSTIDQSNSQCESDVECGPGTAQVGGTIFEYQLIDGSAQYPNWSTAVKETRSSCRSITVRWAQAGTQPDTTHVEIVRTDANPQSSVTGPNTIGKMTASLDAHAWYLDDSANANNTIIGHDGVYINAGLSCYTANGL